jgi:phosphate transport system substrate-binding protein
VDPKEYKVALDGLAVVVHPENPISGLSMEQLSDIFTGKIKNWKEVGGSDTKIVVLSREVNSGTHVYFKEHVLRKGNAKGPEEFAPDALLLPSSQAIADEVSTNKSAIGYYGMGYISKAQKAIAVSKDASAKGVLPTIEAVVSGDYPISRPLYLYSKGLAKDQVRIFLEYILSDEGQAIVSQQDFVPLK